MNIKKHLIAGLVLAAFAGASSAQSLDYSVTGLSGTWAWGDTEWNDVSGAGSVNDTTNVSTVNGLFHSAYVYAAPSAATPNGIYSYPNAASVTFSTQQSVYDTLTLLSSRSYNSGTTITVDYSADGGLTWANALQSTAGALGWVDVGTGGTATETLNLNLGGVTGDELRFTADGGQISLHTASIEGVSAVPEPASIAMLMMGLGVVGLSAKRRRAAK